MPPRRPNDGGPRVNELIRAPKIRVIDENGEMLGVMSVPEGLQKAEDAGLDLVEISPGTDPPVCKILDYGKYKYEMQKKANEARKKQKTVELKEIKIRPTIGDHDYQVKLRSARRFLEEEDKVKVTLRLRGREMAHIDLAMKVLHRFRDDLIDLSKVEQQPKMEGRQAIMLLIPDKAAALVAAKQKAAVAPPVTPPEAGGAPSA